MEGYDSWYDEDDPTAQKEETGEKPAPAAANRKSVVVFESDEANQHLTRSASGGIPSSQDARKSRVFPNVEVQSRRQTRMLNPDADLREPVYTRLRWPFALTAIICLLGSFIMFVLGCICISDYYVENASSDISGVFNACGPAGGGGGIVMIIAGCLGSLIAGYQLWRLREPIFQLVGYKSYA